MSYLQVWITYLHAIFIKWLSYVASSFFILIFCYVCLCGESNYSEKEQKFPTKLPRMNAYNDWYKREKKKEEFKKLEGGYVHVPHLLPFYSDEFSNAW